MHSGSSRPSKMLLASSNPDDIIHEGQPHFQAPSGGFRRHEDAGSIAREAPSEPAPVIEDLPPMYNPGWDGNTPR